MADFRIFCFVIATLLASSSAWSFEPPPFPLSEAQLKAYRAYAATAGEKAFAAGSGGQFSAQSGFASAAAAVSKALKACDKDVASDGQRCIIIDLNGTMLPPALELAQQSRADQSMLDKPIALRDLTLDAGAWAALEDLKQKGGHTAFAISLKGSWARSWDASSPDEADSEALAACDKNEKAKTAKCFVVARDGKLLDTGEFTIAPDLSVSRQISQ